MYPYLVLQIRKFIKNIWIKYYATRRERSSLREHLDLTPDRGRGLWRSWFVLLPLVPLVYYLAFVRARYEQYSISFTTAQSRPEVWNNYSTKPTSLFLNDAKAAVNIISKDFDSNRFTTKMFAEFGKFKPGNVRWKSLNEDKKHTLKPNGELVWCTTESLSELQLKNNMLTTNLSFNESYRDLLDMGGYYTPRTCKSRHRVAILVPYRNRPINLVTFLYNIHPFLIDQKLEYRIFVIEQNGTELFNKGRIFNVGYKEAMKYGKWQCLIFHDVDLLPASKKILYTCPTWPRHMCGAVLFNNKSEPALHSYFGGVSSITVKHYEDVNGFSNAYWGWGGEDTDMFFRFKSKGFPVMRYNKLIAKYLSLPHEKLPKSPERKELLRSAVDRMKYDGLSSIEYRVLSVKLHHLYTHILTDINPNRSTISITSSSRIW